MGRDIGHIFDDEDERSGRRLGEAETVDHLTRRQPAARLDDLLREIGKDRIGAAKGYDGELGEKHRDAGKHMARAKGDQDQCDGQEP